jgi:hypothetical protein
MARRRKSHRRKHHANPRRHRRASRRRYHRNPLKLGGGMGSFGSALLWGGAGYAASKLAGNFLRKYLPAAIPAPDLVSAIGGGVAASFAGGFVAKSSEAKAALRVGAMIPTVEAAVNMTALGAMLGTQKVVMIAPPAPGSGGSGVSAALAAALSADLRDEYASDY